MKRKEKKKEEGAHDGHNAEAPRAWQCSDKSPGLGFFSASEHFDYWEKYWDKVFIDEMSASFSAPVSEQGLSDNVGNIVS